MENIKISENFSIKGYWWLPDKPENEVPGDLIYEPDNQLRLELNGALGSTAKPVEEPEIILGITPKGKKVTLAKCHGSGFSLGMPGYQTENYYGSFITYGHHFNSLSEMRFKKFFIRFKYLDSWVNINGFKEYQTDHEKGDTRLDYSTPSEIILYENTSFKIKLHFYVNRPAFVSRTSSSVKLVEEKRFVIEFRNRVTYKRYLNLITILKNFLSLATSETVIPLDINATVFTKPRNEPKFNTIFTNFIYRFQFIGIEAFETELEERNQLFTYLAVKDNIQYYMKNWIENFERLEAVHELYFSIINNPKLYLKSQFLNSINALESYHRQISAVDISLRQRLQSILAQHKSTKSLFIRNNIHFLSKVIDTRNYYTHYDERKKKKALRGIALYKATRKLMALLEICLLSEMGMSEEKLKSLFLTSERYQDIKAT